MVNLYIYSVNWFIFWWSKSVPVVSLAKIWIALKILRIDFFPSIPLSLSFSQIDLTNFIFIYRLKLECEKLANEKTEMQRHYVMVSFQSFFFVFLFYIMHDSVEQNRFITH